MSTFDIASHEYKANSEALVMHIGRMLACVLIEALRGIFSSIRIDWKIQYKDFVNSIAIYRCLDGAESCLCESDVIKCVCVTL